MTKRKFKFRVWYKPEKRWLDPFAEEDPIISLKDFGDGSKVYVFDRETKEWTCLNKNDYVIQQYTGINDKNGKEIYEGDILKVPYAMEVLVSVEFNSENYGEVLGFNLMNFPDGGALEYYYGKSPSSSCEVCGNIFEGIYGSNR